MLLFYRSVWNDMVSQQKTRLAKLRAILGPSGSESRFPKLVGLSPSWIKKCSAGHLPMTARAASAIHDATGVDLIWLIGDNPSPIPVEDDGRTPYTLDSYNYWKYTNSSEEGDYAKFYNPVSLGLILRVLTNVATSKKQTAASCELFEFAQKFKATYGAAESCGVYSEVAKEVSLLGLSPKQRSRALKPDLDLQNLPAGVKVKKTGGLTIISGKLESTPTPQKKQPSRKSASKG
jgi:hypothetical protein